MGTSDTNPNKYKYTQHISNTYVKLVSVPFPLIPYFAVLTAFFSWTFPTYCTHVSLDHSSVQEGEEAMQQKVSSSLR